MAVHIFDKPLDNDVNSKPDYATEMPMSDSDSTSVLQAIANLENKYETFNFSAYLDTGGIAQGGTGMAQVPITIPTGYKTTGIMSMSLVHPGVAFGLVLTCGIGKDLSGTQTIYVSYYSPKAVTGSNTDVTFYVECVKV